MAWKESTFRRRARQKAEFEQWKKDFAEVLDRAFSHCRNESKPYEDDGGDDYERMA